MRSIDILPVVNDYLDKGDYSNENANMLWNPNGLLFSVGGEGLKKDYLYRMRKAGHEELAELHERGGVHIHDLSLGFTTPYCCGHSLPVLLQEGIKAGSVTSAPAKHIRSAINHMVNYIGAASNEFAGAQAFSDVDLYLSPYAYKCYLDYLKITNGNYELSKVLAKRDIKQSLQEFVFHLNYNTRYGGQAPFSNITLALSCPSDMENREARVADIDLSNYSPWELWKESVTYGKLEEWQHIVCSLMLDVYIEGDAKGKGFTFPVLTLNVTEEFFNHPLKEKIYHLTSKYGTPYFQNYINGYSGGNKITPGDCRSMCCRLSINETEIKKHIGGLFGNAEQTGSIQVVTISLPYLAQMCLDDLYMNKGDHNFLEFFEELNDWMEMIKREQLWKREIVEEYFNKGLFPIAKSNFKRGFTTFFTTIGFVGLWECVEILLGDSNSFTSKEGMELAKRILNFMVNKSSNITKETGKLFNIESTPAESASYKLAKKALKRFPNIKYRGKKSAPYFTNSCQIPVEMQDDLDLIFLTQSQLQAIPSGGTVVHFYVGEKLEDRDIETIIKTVCKTNIPYFSITTVYSECVVHGIIYGSHQYCPFEHTPEEMKFIKDNYPNLLVGDSIKLDKGEQNKAEKIYERENV